MRTYKLDDTRTIPPIEFPIETPDGVVHVFRATRRPPLDVIQAWFAVRVNDEGQRMFHVSTLIQALQRLVLDKVWVEGDGNGTEPHWEDVDDQERLMKLVAGDGPFRLSHTELAQLVMDLLDEATANPTGASS